MGAGAGLVDAGAGEHGEALDVGRAAVHAPLAEGAVRAEAGALPGRGGGDGRKGAFGRDWVGVRDRVLSTEERVLERKRGTEEFKRVGERARARERERERERERGRVREREREAAMHPAPSTLPSSREAGGTSGVDGVDGADQLNDGKASAPAQIIRRGSRDAVERLDRPDAETEVETA